MAWFHAIAVALSATLLVACRGSGAAELPSDFAITINEAGRRVRLDVHGAVEFYGEWFVYRKGRHVWQVSPDAVQSLSPRLDELEISAYRSKTFCAADDACRTDVAVRWKGATRKFSYSCNCENPLAESFRQLVDAVMRVSGAAREVCASAFDERCIDYPSRDSGKTLFAKNGCDTCHSVDGSEKLGPTMKDIFGRKTELVGGRVVPADESYLREAILRPHTHLVAGYGPSMPAYQGKIRMGQLDALVQYIRSFR